MPAWATGMGRGGCVCVQYVLTYSTKRITRTQKITKIYTYDIPIPIARQDTKKKDNTRVYSMRCNGKSGCENDTQKKIYIELKPSLLSAMPRAHRHT